MDDNLWILERIRSFSDRVFFIDEGIRYRYDDLYNQIHLYLRKIKDYGIKPGDCVALLGGGFFDYIPVLCVLILNQNIIVPADRSSAEQLEDMLKISQARFIIDISETGKMSVEKLEYKTENTLLLKLKAEQEAGIIIFTSGSTGAAKAAAIKISGLLKAYKDSVRRSYIGLIFLKIDHIGGINTLFSMMLNGGTIVTIKTRTPDEVCEKIAENRVELLPTTPTFLNMMMISGAHLKYDLSSLQVISYGTEPMPEETLKEITNYFKGITKPG